MRLTIRWDAGMGCYRVNVPNYEGGEVVTADEFDEVAQLSHQYRNEAEALRREVARLHGAIESARRATVR